ncbi:hypothetical protein BvCmsB5655_03608 [Escherichia coli]|nr:hypothetical protein BvCmsB5655_03608 [Escherichia coli]
MKRLSYKDYSKLISTLQPEIRRINYLPISNEERVVLKNELILKRTVGTNYQDNSVRDLIRGLMITIKAKCY